MATYEEKNLYSRISKALHRRWLRYGWGPETFLLNIHHWHEIEEYFYRVRGFVPNGFYVGEMKFMRTKLILRKRKN